MTPIKIQLSHLHEISTAILQRQRGRQLWLTSIIYDIWFLRNSSLAIVYYSIYVFMSLNLFILSDAASYRDFLFLCKLKEAVDNLISEQHATRSFLLSSKCYQPNNHGWSHYTNILARPKNYDSRWMLVILVCINRGVSRLHICLNYCTYFYSVMYTVFRILHHSFCLMNLYP